MKDLKLWTNRIILLLSIVGMLLCAYLWWIQVSDTIVPCTDDGCETVLNSEYGKILGVPMAVYGFFFYVGVWFLAFERSLIKHKLLDLFLGILIVWGVLFGVYLRYLEFAKIGDICIWCWGSFGITLVMLGVFIFEHLKLRKAV